jgi:hypothetical protein
MTPSFDLAFGRDTRPVRGWAELITSLPGWQRADKFAVMTKETAGMFALEISES